MALFNQLSGLASDATFKRILVAPRDLRSGLTEKIAREKQNHLDGKPSYIRWKLNSLLDEEIIEALYDAAKAGVRIDIITRGICALRLSHVAKYRNVRIRSILGRFLEHSRIFHFQNSQEPEYFIGSADMMDRNLNRRIETLVQIKNGAHTSALDEILTQSFNDQFGHWEMDENDIWRHKQGSSINGSTVDYQNYFLHKVDERYAK